MRIYIGGPHFTPYARADILSHVSKLRSLGHKCFVPQEELRKFKSLSFTHDQIFEKKIYHLQLAEAMIVHLDGPDVCSGLACEMGIYYEFKKQYSTKKGILGILRDDRSWGRNKKGVGECLNFFTMGCIEKDGSIYNSFDHLLEHLSKWQNDLDLLNG